MQVKFHRLEDIEIRSLGCSGLVRLYNPERGTISIFLGDSTDPVEQLESVEDFGQAIVDEARERIKEVHDEDGS